MRTCPTESFRRFVTSIPTRRTSRPTTLSKPTTFSYGLSLDCTATPSFPKTLTFISAVWSSAILPSSFSTCRQLPDRAHQTTSSFQLYPAIGIRRRLERQHLGSPVRTKHLETRFSEEHRRFGYITPLRLTSPATVVELEACRCVLVGCWSRRLDEKDPGTAAHAPSAGEVDLCRSC